MDRLARADLADYRDHGFDLALFNYYFDVKEDLDGSFTCDLSQLARDLEYWKTLGSSAPVAVTPGRRPSAGGRRLDPPGRQALTATVIGHP